MTPEAAKSVFDAMRYAADLGFDYGTVYGVALTVVGYFLFVLVRAL